MQGFFLFSRRCRATAAFGVCIGACLAAAVSLAGCGPAKDAPGLREPSEISSPFAGVSSVYAACEAMCREDTALALVTRTGCLEGCEEAWNRFPLRGRTFTDRRDCLDALLREEQLRDNRVAEMKLWCDAKWSHVHNRKGCYMAAERFYASLPPEDICGEAAQSAPAEPSKTPAAQPETPPEPQETPPAPEDTPSATPHAGQPAEPLAPSPVSHGIQPAGPLDPPPYVAGQSAAAPEKEPEEKSASPLPKIHDTPKYQKPAPKKAPPAKEEKTAEKKAPEKNTLKKTPEENTPEKNTPKGNTLEPAPPAVPQAPSSPEPAPAPPAVPRAPSSPEPAPALPAAPQLPPAQGGADAPKPETGTKQPLPAADPGRQAVSEKPESPAPKPVLPKPVLPEPGERPEPGLNANRPIPKATDQDVKQPVPPVRTPPVPSMLNKPYETPTIISPQIDMPGK